MKKNNKFIAGILAVSLAFCAGVIPESITPVVSMTASAENYTYENLTYDFSEDGTIEITGCDKSVTEIVIPSEIDGVPVTSIGDRAFILCSDLTEITIPDSVTNIGTYAFANTIWLEEKRKENPLVIVNNILIDAENCFGDVIIPDGVTSIGDEVFGDCENLTSITMPDSVTSIGESAFCYCSNLKSITIPDSVTSIGDYAFEETAWLKEKRKENPLVIVNNILIDGQTCSGDVIIPDGVTTISPPAFRFSDLTSIIIPDSITSINDRAFYWCDNLTSVTIPDSVTSIGESAFYYCPNLKSITIPDSVTTIGGNAFCSCSQLTSITMPDDITVIGDIDFQNCRNLTSITIPDSVTSIGKDTFDCCFKLTSVTIPDSVTSIDDTAFYDCQDLTSINVSENNIYYSDTDGILFNKDKTELLQYPRKKDNKEYVIPDTVTNINYRAFMYCENLISVTIPNNVIYIDNSAFGYCRSLTSITIPESVRAIGCAAFASCESLEAITILNPECIIYNLSSTICSSYSSYNDGDFRNYIFNGTIYGYENSTVQAYAEKYNRKFIALDKENTATGDINGDGKFNVSDLVTLQKYLLGASDSEISDWKQADFTGDGVLDVFDLCLMKKKIIQK